MSPRWPGRGDRPGRGGSEVPGDVLAASGLPRGERVLASARGTDGTWLLGTRTSLAVVGPEVAVLAWEEVEDAGWDAEEDAVRLRELGASYGAPRREWVVVVAGEQPRAFLQLLRERVTASVVLQRRTTLQGRRGVTVSCRRNPAGGPLTWHVAFDPGLEPTDPVVLAVAEDLLAQARSELGEAAHETPTGWRPPA